MAGVHY